MDVLVTDDLPFRFNVLLKGPGEIMQALLITHLTTVKVESRKSTPLSRHYSSLRIQYIIQQQYHLRKRKWCKFNGNNNK